MLRTGSILLALCLGIAGAWWAAPRWMDARALRQIQADEQSVRERGWRWLTSLRPGTGELRAAALLSRINDQLDRADDLILLHAADELRGPRLWDWDHQPAPLLLRELRLRAELHPGDQQLAAMTMFACPFDAPEDDVVDVVNRLLQSDDRAARTAAFDAFCAWAGPGRASRLSELQIRADDEGLLRLRELGLSWADQHETSDLPDRELRPDVLEAALLRRIVQQPRSLPPVQMIVNDRDLAASIASIYLLRHSETELAAQHLESLAGEGLPAALFALHARQPERERAAAQDVFANPAERPSRRRLAAWRLPSVDKTVLRRLLEAAPAETDDSVAATALLAERHLDHPTRVDLAGEWLRDLQNDRKRAGVLLAVLLNEHALIVRELEKLPGDRHLRTIARLGAAVLGEEPDDDAAILAHRVMHKPDGDFDPDPVLCALAAGETGFLGLLVTPPAGSLRLAVQHRALLIERFVPHWHELAGRPISGDVRSIRLHFDWLQSRWLLEQRRLAFDAETKTYVLDRHSNR